MNHLKVKIVFNHVSKKLAVIVLITAIAVTSFATLGDGNKSKSSHTPTSSLLSSRTNRPGYFSLRSGYTYRGNQVITQEQNKYISLNTTVTYRVGNTTYIVPLKKKVLLNNVKIDIGNRSLRRN